MSIPNINHPRRNPMHTNLSILDRFERAADNLEFPELEVPVLTGAQRQGDVFLLPVTVDKAKGSEVIGTKGIIVVRAETNSANTHTLFALTGECRWTPNARADRDGELVQGWLTVAAESEATLIHTEEHSALAVGPGTYEVRRQREYAGQWRRVAD